MRSFVFSVLSILVASSSASAKVCAPSADAIYANASLKAKVCAFGGVRALVGKWEAASFIHRAFIPSATFRIGNGGKEAGRIFVELNGHPEVQLHVCDTDDSKNNTLAIKLINSPIPIDTIYSRPVKIGTVIKLTQKEHGSADFKKVVNWGDRLALDIACPPPAPPASPKPKPAPKPAPAPAPPALGGTRSAPKQTAQKPAAEQSTTEKVTSWFKSWRDE